VDTDWLQLGGQRPAEALEQLRADAAWVAREIHAEITALSTPEGHWSSGSQAAYGERRDALGRRLAAAHEHVITAVSVLDALRAAERDTLPGPATAGWG